jgi:hypothetical protein
MPGQTQPEAPEVGKQFQMSTCAAGRPWIHSVKRSDGHPIVKVRRRSVTSDWIRTQMSVAQGYFVPISEHSLRLHVALWQKTSSETASDCHPAERAVFRRNGMRSDLVFRALAIFRTGSRFVELRRRRADPDATFTLPEPARGGTR